MKKKDEDTIRFYKENFLTRLKYQSILNTLPVSEQKKIEETIRLTSLLEIGSPDDLKTIQWKYIEDPLTYLYTPNKITFLEQCPFPLWGNSFTKKIKNFSQREYQDITNIFFKRKKTITEPEWIINSFFSNEANDRLEEDIFQIVRNDKFLNKKYTDSVVQLKENFWNLLLNQGLTGNTFLESYIFGEKTQVKLFDIVLNINMQNLDEYISKIEKITKWKTPEDLNSTLFSYLLVQGEKNIPSFQKILINQKDNIDWFFSKNGTVEIKSLNNENHFVFTPTILSEFLKKYFFETKSKLCDDYFFKQSYHLWENLPFDKQIVLFDYILQELSQNFYNFPEQLADNFSKKFKNFSSEFKSHVFVSLFKTHLDDPFCLDTCEDINSFFPMLPILASIFPPQEVLTFTDISNFLTKINDIYDDSRCSLQIKNKIIKNLTPWIKKSYQAMFIDIFSQYPDFEDKDFDDKIQMWIEKKIYI